MKNLLIGDWYCSECQAHNYAKREECFKCQHVKDDSDEVIHHLQNDERVGDWYCSACQAHNYARREDCYKCHHEKNEEDEVVNQAHHQERVGDWYCAKCEAHNYAKREECFKCHHPKDEQDEVVLQVAHEERPHFRQHTPKPKGGQRLRRGDWVCPNRRCNAINYASRRECFECGEPRVSRESEWTCPECNYDNYSFRKECKNCSYKNPERPKLREGDWECQCGHVNFARRTECQKCEAVRE